MSTTPADRPERAPGLDHLWAGWRLAYVAGTGTGPGEAAPSGADPAPDGDGDGAPAPAPDPVGTCVFCRILASGADDDEVGVVWHGEHCVALLNAYPYTNGHVMVMPRAHRARLDALGDAERRELWDGVSAAVAALERAYRPDGINVGLNLGQAAGAGVPGHLHVHCLPRWSGDTNFMTTVANARVLPESLSSSGERLRAAWPGVAHDS